METKANHVLIGAFTILISVLAVLFAPRGVLGVFEKLGKYFSERKKS